MCIIGLGFPHDPAAGFGLTYGVGLQAFVLVASLRPLPPYSVWRRALIDFPWKPTQAKGVWRYDGDSFRTDVQRGEVRSLAGLPTPLVAACRALESRPGVDAIHAVAFPVQTKSGTDGRPAPP